MSVCAAAYMNGASSLLSPHAHLAGRRRPGGGSRAVGGRGQAAAAFTLDRQWPGAAGGRVA